MKTEKILSTQKLAQHYAGMSRALTGKQAALHQELSSIFYKQARQLMGVEE